MPVNNKIDERNKDIKIYRDEYKTSKIYGSKTITIEDSKLVTSIRDYIKQEGIKEGQYLFVEHDKRFMKDFRKELGNNNVTWKHREGIIVEKLL